MRLRNVPKDSAASDGTMLTSASRQLRSVCVDVESTFLGRIRFTQLKDAKREIMKNDQKIQSENIHGHKESLAAILKMVRRIKRGLFVVRSIELRKEFLGGWRVVIYLGENERGQDSR